MCKWSSYLKGPKKDLIEQTRDNALLLSTGAQLNNKQLTEVYKWFQDKLRIITPEVKLKNVTIDMLLTEANK